MCNIDYVEQHLVRVRSDPFLDLNKFLNDLDLENVKILVFYIALDYVLLYNGNVFG